uniref:Uncharacterized protein n=1 Tax=Leersia perrieri TaxID=77586 RepID=A0A0D9WHW0_9ORYZ
MHFHLTSVHPHPCEPRHASPSTLPLYRCHLRTDAARYLPPSPSVFAVLPSHRPLHIGVSAPLIIGYNVRHISQETYDIQANMEVIAINQDNVVIALYDALN